jgi:two-component system, OmpR family, sensor histidine kinase KdpD
VFAQDFKSCGAASGGPVGSIPTHFRHRLHNAISMEASAQHQARISIVGMAWLLGRLLVTLGVIAGISAVLLGGVRANATTAALIYLIAILVIATAWGFVEAAAASIAAMLCFNYFFLPPLGALTIADPQNWVALVAFLITSITASQLSARAKRRTREATHRQQEMEKLYALSCALLLTDTSQPVAKSIARQIAHTFELPAVAFYDRHGHEVYQAGREDLLGVDDMLQEAALRGTQFRDDSMQLVVTSVRLGGEPIGSLAVKGASLSDAALQSLSNLMAVGLEKAHAQETANRAEAARQSEELRSTLLDAITHEFKTPLTSLKAATTALLSDPANRFQEYREMITIADEEVNRLTRLLTEAIQTAKVESGKLQPERELQSVSSLVSRTVNQMKLQLAGRELHISAPDRLPLIFVDPELVELAIRQVIENGLKYSPPDTPLTITVQAAESSVGIVIADQGPGIPESDQDRIFDKFYRGSKDRHKVTGTGMGLAIAREILRVHGGAISVQSSPGRGSEFRISIPAAPREKIA